MALGQVEDYKLRDLVAIFMRWRLVAFVAFLAVLIPGVLVTFLIIPKYEATATILVNRQSAAPAYSVSTGQGGVPSPLFRSVDRKEEVKTVAETIKTRAIIVAVIDEDGITQADLDRIRDYRKYVAAVIDWIFDTAEWLWDEFKFGLGLATRPTVAEQEFLEREDLIADVRDRISVTPIVDTNVLAVSFDARDPKLAQRAVNAIVEEFLSTEARSDRSQARDFFDEETRMVEKELQAAEAELAEYRRANHAYEIEAQRSLILQNLANLRANYTGIVAQRAQKEAAIAALKEQLRTDPQFQREIRKDLIDAEVDFAASDAELKVLEEGIADRLGELAELNRTELRTKELQRRVAVQEAAYNLRQRNLEQARVTEEMARARLSQVQIVDFASFPLRPVRPRKLLYLGIVLGAAVLAALSAPFLAHLNDTTLWNEHEVARLLDVPFVAAFPVLKR